DSPATRRVRCGNASGTSRVVRITRRRTGKVERVPRHESGPAIAPAGRFPQFDFRVPLTPLTLEVSRGSTASPGARQGLLLPPLRADLRAPAGPRDGRDSCVGGAEVRVPELLLSALDSRRVLRRPTVRGDGGGVGRFVHFLLPDRAGPGHAARLLPRRPPPPGPLAGLLHPHRLRGGRAPAHGGGP